MNETINSEVRKELDAANWDDLLPRLLKYARSKLYKTQLVSKITIEPEDLVSEAIALAYGVGQNDGYRHWNKETFPDLCIFLFSVIKSLVSHKIEHHIKFPAQEIGDFDGATQTPTPEEVIIQKNNLSKIYQRIYESVEGDDEMETVILCIEEGFDTPREIASQTGYEIPRVNNILKRIRRKLSPLKDEIISEKRN